MCYKSKHSVTGPVLHHLLMLRLEVRCYRGRADQGMAALMTQLRCIRKSEVTSCGQSFHGMLKVLGSSGVCQTAKYEVRALLQTLGPQE